MDTDRDGYLTITEVKRLVKNKQCSDMPRGVSRRILKMADEDGDGKLDFEEFFKLSQEHDWLVGHYVARYCRWLVPDPRRTMVSGSPDQIGETVMIYLFCPGVYGRIVLLRSPYTPVVCRVPYYLVMGATVRL